MVRQALKGLLASAVAAVAVVVSLGALTAADDKTPSIEEIMKKGHGSKGLVKGLKAEVKDGKWDDAKNDATLLKAFGEALGKNKPPKGSEASWKKLSDQYKTETAAVLTAVVKKDASAADAALAAIGKSCKACHDAHQP